jgi:tRNA(Ile)-lysidine synthase
VAGETRKRNLPFFDAIIPRGVPTGESPEAYWREQRYTFLDKVARDADLPIVLGHQMGDCLEEYLICTLKRGYTGTIKYRRGDCIRPFRLWKREDILRYATEERVPFLEDPMNADIKYLRSFVRFVLVPQVLKVNPGIWNIVERLIIVERLMREQDLT